MGVAMGGNDAVADTTGQRGAVDVAGTERQRPAVRAGQQDLAALKTWYQQPSHGPGIRPGPRPDLLSRLGRRPGPLKKPLRKPRLDRDVKTMAHQTETGGQQ